MFIAVGTIYSAVGAAAGTSQRYWDFSQRCRDFSALLELLKALLGLLTALLGLVMVLNEMLKDQLGMVIALWEHSQVGTAHWLSRWQC